VAELAVVIVSWNVRNLILDALESLYADIKDFDAEVYVVDNASSDDSVEAIRSHFPQVNLIVSEINLGFGGGNNLALRHIGFGKTDVDPNSLPNAVYLLNSDTITQHGATRCLYDTLMSKPEIGVVGAQLAYGDGSFQHGAFAFPGISQLWVEFFPTPGRFIEGGFNGRYGQSLYATGKPFPVDFTLGATMMLKREVILYTGMFDEDFFMYCEEIDWAWRIRKAGWQIFCVPQAHVTHLAGQSTSQVKPRSIRNLWESRLLLFKKHYPAWKYWLARQMIAVGMWYKAQREESPELRAVYDEIRHKVRAS